MRFVEALLAAIIAVIIAMIGTLIALVWFSVTWPWYIWKGLHRAAHPR